MGKFAAHRPRIAKGFESLANVSTTQGTEVAHTGQPIVRPAQVLHQLPWQAKGQVKAADPSLRLAQPIGKARQRVKTQQLLELNPPRLRRAYGDDDGFAFAGAAAEIAADQKGLRHVSPKPVLWCSRKRCVVKRGQ